MFLKYSSDRPSSKGINRVSVECEPVNQPEKMGDGIKKGNKIDKMRIAK